MTITAVLLHYWESRLDNIDKIIKSLTQGLRTPNNIILLNNNPKYVLSKSNVKCINAADNLYSRARYPISLLTPSDYYLFVDDDLMVEKGTLANLEKRAGVANLGLMGRKVTGKYSESKIIKSTKIKKPTEVDVLIRLYFVPFGGVLKALQYEHTHDVGREDDLALSFSAPAFLVPAGKNEYIKDLDDGGVGIARRANHFGIRDEVFARLNE